jgi:amidase
MKPTVGSTPMDGIFVISTTFDTVGAMAKSVDDLATLIGYVQLKGPSDDSPIPNYSDVFQKDWSGLRLGFGDPDKWWLPLGLVTPIQEVSALIVSILSSLFISGQRNITRTQSRKHRTR